MKFLKTLFRPKTKHIDVEAKQQKVNALLKESRARQSHINSISEWLNNRRLENGLGEDFEITLTHGRRA